MTETLLIKPASHQGESLRGFLLRISEANFCRSSDWIKDLPEEITRVRTMIGFKLYGRVPAWLRRNGDPLVIPAIIKHQHILGDRARCCPECLAEIGYWPAEWEHIFYTVCHRHQRLLLDQCPHCRSVLTWRRSQLMFCKCGSLISDWRVGADVCDEESELCAVVVKSFWKETGRARERTKQSELDDLLSKISIDQLSRLIFVLGTYSAASDEARRFGNHKVLEVDEARKLVLLTARMLSDWPTRFHEFLREAGGYHHAEAVCHESPRHFAMFGKALHTQFKKPGLNFVVTAYRDFVIENWKGILNRRHKWASSNDVKTQRYIPAAAVARALRISSDRVKELVNKDILRGYVKQTAKQRRFFVIERSSLIGAEEYLNDHVTLGGAASLLGLPKRRVEELIIGRFLTEIVDERRAGRIRLFSRSEIAAFVRRLSAASRESKEEDNLISGAVILKTHLASGNEFTSLIRDILLGKLLSVHLPTPKLGFRELLFDREEFSVWRTSLRLCSENVLLTIVAAATRLGIKDEVAYHLVRTGILQSSTMLFGKRTCQLVRLRDIESFEQTYVSLVALASLRGTSPKAMVKKMNVLGIHPIIGPDIDACRQYFFNRNMVISKLSGNIRYNGQDILEGIVIDHHLGSS